MARAIDREAARRGDPCEGEDVTGDLDGGVYNVRHDQVGGGVSTASTPLLCVCDAPTQEVSTGGAGEGRLGCVPGLAHMRTHIHTQMHACARGCVSY